MIKLIIIVLIFFLSFQPKAEAAQCRIIAEDGTQWWSGDKSCNPTLFQATSQGWGIMGCTDDSKNKYTIRDDFVESKGTELICDEDSGEDSGEGSGGDSGGGSGGDSGDGSGGDSGGGSGGDSEGDSGGGSGGDSGGGSGGNGSGGSGSGGSGDDGGNDGGDEEAPECENAELLEINPKTWNDSTDISFDNIKSQFSSKFPLDMVVVSSENANGEEDCPVFELMGRSMPACVILMLVRASKWPIILSMIIRAIFSL